MKLARMVVAGPDGPISRLVTAQPEQERVVDLLTAERLRLERGGATHEAALRLAAALFPPSMSAAIALGDAFLEAAQRAVASAGDESFVALNEVQWLSPVDPPLLRDFVAFAQHARAMSAQRGVPFAPEMSKLPVYYKGNASTLIGHEREVPWPSYSAHMDYELEVGFIIGKPARDILPEDALEYLFGVTIFNDFSARDMQGREMSAEMGPAKGKDFGGALGPWIVTRDELDVHNLTMVARVNGEEWSRGSSSSITWSVEELIAYASLGETVWPGELLGSGTVGTGTGAEHGKRLQPGDVVELEIEGIGVLRNRVGQPEPRRWTPAPRAEENPPGA